MIVCVCFTLYAEHLCIYEHDRSMTEIKVSEMYPYISSYYNFVPYHREITHSMYFEEKWFQQFLIVCNM
jgi:membrane-bound metal-dependent hydrolase YbcI (DUF457 family)